MGIFSRVSDIVNSNINVLLDKAEDPEKMVRLMIMEMEETLVEVRTTSARLIADKKTLLRKGDQLAEVAGEWSRKAELAIQKGREDLARAALLEKQRVETEVEDIAAEIEEYDISLTKLNEDLAQLQAKLADAKARQKSLVMRTKAGRSQLDMRRHLHKDAIEDALGKFESYERKLDELEGQVEAFDLGQQELADEISGLENDDKIDAELAAMKARMQKDSAPEA